MVFDGNIPIWVMITCHVFLFFFLLVMLEMRGNCALEGGVEGGNNKCMNESTSLFKDGGKANRDDEFFFIYFLISNLKLKPIDQFCTRKKFDKANALRDAEKWRVKHFES